MLYIIRGLPGSGKSTLANALAAQLNSTFDHDAYYVMAPVPVVVFEADQYFMQSGQYVFDPKLLPAAHADCQSRVERHIMAGGIPIVANTFTQRWEYQPYLEMAADYDIPAQVIDVHGDFGSIHNVPDETITRMRNRWEPHNGR
jgi:predicted kinase